VPFQDYEDLFIRVAVKPRTATRLQVDEDEAYVGSAELVALQLGVDQLIALHHRVSRLGHDR
jgi:hypothetical protein